MADNDFSATAIERKNRFNDQQLREKETERKAFSILRRIENATVEDCIQGALRRARHEARMEYNKNIDEQGNAMYKYYQSGNTFPYFC